MLEFWNQMYWLFVCRYFKGELFYFQQLEYIMGIPLDKLSKSVEEGKKIAEKILRSLEGNQKIGIQTRELVIPSKESAISSLPGLQNKTQLSTLNRLIYGDNLLVLPALLGGGGFVVYLI